MIDTRSANGAPGFYFLANVLFLHLPWLPNGGVFMDERQKASGQQPEEQKAFYNTVIIPYITAMSMAERMPTAAPSSFSGEKTE